MLHETVFSQSINVLYVGQYNGFFLNIAHSLLKTSLLSIKPSSTLTSFVSSQFFQQPSRDQDWSAVLVIRPGLPLPLWVQAALSFLLPSTISPLSELPFLYLAFLSIPAITGDEI